MSNSTILEESASIDPGFSAQNNSALLNFIELFNQNTQPPTQEFIFESGEEYLLITFYILILLLGLIFNAAIIWVILGKWISFILLCFLLNKVFKIVPR